MPPLPRRFRQLNRGPVFFWHASSNRNRTSRPFIHFPPLHSPPLPALCYFVQSQTVRIIWTVPVYTTSAWLCLCFPAKAMYIHGVRELYEAYVIYCFLQYLVHYLGTNRLE